MDKTEITGSFADRLQDLIDEKKKEKITLQDIANATGILKGSLSKYQNNAVEIGIFNLVKLAEYFDVSVDYLLGITNVRKPLNDDDSKNLRITCDYTGLSQDSIETLNYFKEWLPEYVATIELLIQTISLNKHIIPYEMGLTTYFNEGLLSSLTNYFYTDFLHKRGKFNITLSGNLLETNSTNRDVSSNTYIEDLIKIDEIEVSEVIQQVLMNTVIDNLKSEKKSNRFYEYLPKGYYLKRGKTENSFSDIEEDEDLPF